MCNITLSLSDKLKWVRLDKRSSHLKKKIFDLKALSFICLQPTLHLFQFKTQLTPTNHAIRTHYFNVIKPLYLYRFHLDFFNSIFLNKASHFCICRAFRLCDHCFSHNARRTLIEQNNATHKLSTRASFFSLAAWTCALHSINKANGSTHKNLNKCLLKRLRCFPFPYNFFITFHPLLALHFKSSEITSPVGLFDFISLVYFLPPVGTFRYRGFFNTCFSLKQNNATC